MQEQSRVLPHSLEAEEAVLGALLLDNAALHRVTDLLSASDFYVSEHRHIFESVRELVDRGDTADVVTTHEHLKLRGHAAKVSTSHLNALVQSVPSADSARYYANLVHEHAQHRERIRQARLELELAWKTPIAPRAAGHARNTPAAVTHDRAAAIKHARIMLARVLKPRQPPAYPVRALGPLADACEAIAARGQVQPAMAGQALLGAASLLTQGLHNVETLNGTRSTSLYFVTLGDSGDGKSTAQNVALRPVIEWQRNQGEVYRKAIEDHNATTKQLRKGDTPPDPPVCPYRLVSDATIEALRRDLATGLCSQGLFSDEAATIVAGYGMSLEQRAKSAGAFSSLMDSGHISTSRSREGRLERHGRRLAMHWLIQPQAAAESIGDEMLSALGFWPRFLAAWPDPLPPRTPRRFDPANVPAIGAYWRRSTELLAVPLPDDADNSQILQLGPAAYEYLTVAFARFERDGRCGPLLPIKPFALRASEQACRVAGVLTAFAGGREVSGETMAGALELVGYSLHTWFALIDENAADQSAAAALHLFEWLTTRAGWSESLAVIVNAGPSCVRTRDKRDASLAVLQEAGLIVLVDGRAVVTFDGTGAGDEP